MTIRLNLRAATLLAAAGLLAAPSFAFAQAKRVDIPAPKEPPGAITLKAPAPPPGAPPETWSQSSADNVPVVFMFTVEVVPVSRPSSRYPFFNEPPMLMLPVPWPNPVNVPPVVAVFARL